MTEPNNEYQTKSILDYPELRQSIQQFAERIPNLLEQKIQGELKATAIFIIMLIIAVGASFTYLRDLLPR